MDKKLKRVFTSLKSKTEILGGGGSSSNGAQHDQDQSRERATPATSGISPGGPSVEASPPTPPPPPSDDSPESRITYAINLFCISGGPGHSNPGDEVLHLPTIVDLAESSPSAAKAASTAIRKSLDSKKYSRPHMQYNSVMLMRILADNPGPTFTRNLSDPKFVSAVKEIIRGGRDPSVWQILAETLEYFVTDKVVMQEGLQPICELWKKEKAKQLQYQAKHGNPNAASRALEPWARGHTQQYVAPSRPPSNSLPSPPELASRISEAQTSARLLEQLLQSTASKDIPSHELIKEFAERCKLATKSMQNYIRADNPPADPDTLTTLIETNDLLGIALEKHKKTVKEALQKQERYAQDSNARLIDVSDPGIPGHTPPPVQVPTTMSGAAHTEHSPVSPVTPHHSQTTQGQYQQPPITPPQQTQHNEYRF